MPWHCSKPLISKGFQSDGFPHSVDNFHQGSEGNHPVRPFFPDLPAQCRGVFRQVQIVGIPAAAEILHGIGHAFRLVGIPKPQDPVMGEEPRGNDPRDMLCSHPVKPFGMDLRRNEAGYVVDIHGVSLSG